jgi:23S rRNA pseudouridine2605 synthase
MTRLNKFLAENTGISRRQADEAIASGRVTVNGQTAVLGQQIGAESTVCLDDRPVKSRAETVTILLNKPVGYLSSRRSQGGDPTVYDLLPAKYRQLKTAGRLDKDSSGLIILSSSGDLIQKLTHPRHQKTKIYEIELDKPLSPEHQKLITEFGVSLSDGKSQLVLEEIIRPFKRTLGGRKRSASPSAVWRARSPCDRPGNFPPSGLEKLSEELLTGLTISSNYNLLLPSGRGTPASVMSF